MCDSNTMTAAKTGPAASLSFFYYCFFFFSFALTLVLSLCLHGFHRWHSVGKPLFQANDHLLKSIHRCAQLGQRSSGSDLYIYLLYQFFPFLALPAASLCPCVYSVSRFFCARPSEASAFIGLVGVFCRCCRMLLSHRDYTCNYEHYFHCDETFEELEATPHHSSPQHWQLAGIHQNSGSIQWDISWVFLAEVRLFLSAASKAHRWPLTC